MDEGKTVLTEAQAEELISFLLSSAEITIKEPIHYGPLRLVDAVSRLIGFMEDNGAVDGGRLSGKPEGRDRRQEAMGHVGQARFQQLSARDTARHGRVRVLPW